MTTLLEFFVEGRPRPTQTGSIGMRTIKVAGPFGMKVPKGVPYPKRRNLGWVDEFTLKAKRFRPRELLTGPLEAEMFFVVAKPKGRKALDRLPAAPISDPNGDNLGKSLLDAMQGPGEFYVDDAVCSDMVFRKRWVGWRGYPEGVLVRLSRVEVTDVA